MKKHLPSIHFFTKPILAQYSLFIVFSIIFNSTLFALTVPKKQINTAKVKSNVEATQSTTPAVTTATSPTASSPQKVKPHVTTLSTAKTSSATTSMKKISPVQAIAPAEAITPQEEKKDSAISFSNSLSLALEKQAQRQTDGTLSRNWNINYIPVLKVGDFSFSSYLYYEKDMTDSSKKGFWDDTYLQVMYSGWKIFDETIKVSPFYMYEYPLSNPSKFDKGIISTNDIGFKFALNQKRLGLTHFSFAYSIAVGYLQNEYTTRANGDPANEYKISHKVTTGLDFDPISFNVLFRFWNYYSYENVERDVYLFQEGLSYKVNDTISFTLYHSNKAPFLNPENYSRDMKLYDPVNSIVGLSLDLSF